MENLDNTNKTLENAEKELRISDVIPRYNLEFEFSTDYHHTQNGDWLIKDSKGDIIERIPSNEREKAIKRRDKLNGV